MPSLPVFVRSGALALLAASLAASLATAQSPSPTIVRHPRDPQSDGPRIVVTHAGGLLHTTQLLPVDATGEIVAPADAAAQLHHLLDDLTELLAGENESLASVAKLNLYVARDELVVEARSQLLSRFADNLPAVCVVTTDLPRGALVALDAVATYSGSLPPNGTLRRRVPNLFATPRDAHFAVTPMGCRVYVAGQAERGTLREATRKTLESLDRTLEFLGLQWDDVAQVKSFVTPMTSMAEAEDELRRFFADRPIPPLAWVEWKSDLPIEIELVASANRGRPTTADKTGSDVEFLTPPGMTTPTIYSRVTRMHGPTTIFVGGLYGEPGTSGDTQVTRIFEQLNAALAQLDPAARSDLRHLVKATYYVVDNDASGKLNELRPRYYDPRRPPSASKAMVRGVGLPRATITLDMIAVPRMGP